MGDVKQREAPAGALADDTKGSDDHAAIARPTTTPWQDAYAWWVDYCEELVDNDALAYGTYRNYRPHVEDALAFIGKPVETIRFPDLQAALRNWKETTADERGKPVSKATVNTWISAIRHFYAFLVRKLRLEIANEADLLDRPDSQKLARNRRTYEPIPPETFDRIREEAFRRQDYAWAVCARFLWQTMGRISDAFWLRWEDLDLDDGKAIIRWPKAGEPKPKVLYDALCDDLRALRGLERAKPEDPVFRAHLPRPRDPADQRRPRAAFRQWFHRGFRRYAKAVGYGQDVWPHQIRGSAATALAKLGTPTRAIQLQGGWESERALKAYLRDEVEDHREDLQEVLDR